MKQKWIKTMALVACSGLPLAEAIAQVGIGTVTPHASAQLEVTSTDKGVLVSRMTTVQRGSIIAPAEGLLVYDTDTQSFWYYKTGAGWIQIEPSSGGFTLPHLTTVQRNSIIAPGEGLLVYDTDAQSFWYYKTGTGWTQIEPSPGAFTLPYLAAENTPATLFSITNFGDGTPLEGINHSAAANRTAIRGEIANTAPGGFSSAVRGENAGTGGLGIGVWGSQAGSGWGVYGDVPDGIGVFGNASSNGTGVLGHAFAGTGVMGTSINGNAADFFISNNANPSNAIEVATLGNGVGVSATSTGGHGLMGKTSAYSAAGVIGYNTSGEAVVGISSGGSGVGAVVGRNDGTGYGVRGYNTSSGVGVLGQAGQSGGTGQAARFENTNSGNTSEVTTITSNGTGNGLGVHLTNTSNGARGIDVQQSGVGPGVFATSTGGNAVWGITSSISAAGVIGDNTFGEAVVGRNRGATGVGAVVGRNDSSGYGVRGFNTKDGIGVLGQAGISGGTGVGGRFENVNAANTSNALEAVTNGIGGGLSVQLTNASNGARGIDVQQSGVGPGVFATSAGGNAVWGITSSISAAGVIGDNTFGEAVVGRNRGGTGVGAVVGRNDSSGYGVRGFNTKTGIGVLGQAGISGGTGVGGRFENVNAANTSNTLETVTNGIGSGLSVQLTNASNGARGIDVQQSGVGPGVFATSAGGNAVWGITSSISAAGVIGDNTFGEAVVGRNRGGNGVGAVVGRNDSSGYGVRGFNTKTGIGVLGQTGISGGTGTGGRFENVNAANSGNALEAATNGSGAGLHVSQTNNNVATGMLAIFRTSTGNQIRFDKTGKGFFNGGTQNSGADLAEAFDVTEHVSAYEPGDVLVISLDKDRTVEKSEETYSSRILGVYATKPGVLLTEEGVDSDLKDKVPMGVVGVIPTKVCLEGGAIARGDFLVTSSLSGVAMKADLSKVKTGQVIGKALQNFDQAGVGKINVFVNVK